MVSRDTVAGLCESKKFVVSLTSYRVEVVGWLWLVSIVRPIEVVGDSLALNPIKRRAFSCQERVSPRTLPDLSTKKQQSAQNISDVYKAKD